MSDIRHRIGISVPQAEVHAALGTRAGLEKWWTETVEGESAVGESLRFFFGGEEASATMEVVELTPDRIVWRCTQGPDEWLDTTVTYDLKHANDETVILFSHAGWREPVEFMHHCSTKWGSFLLDMKDGLEGGKAKPFPHDRHISSWD